ncbi:MAG: efflux RND transporter periplasmic adaptor subunit [Verrucomicrobiota bacterium]
MKPFLRSPKLPTRRAGISGWGVLSGIVGLAAALTFLGLNFSGVGGGGDSSDYLTAEVINGPFLHEVWERGELESSNNVEVRCEVKASGGVDIIEIIPEGTEVEKGDFLVKLDDSTLQTELIQQEIICSNSESEAQDAEAAFEAAKLELLEYEEGTFVQEEEQLQSEQFVAEENLRRAREYFSYSVTMSQRGYISDVQLEADKFAVAKAQKELDVAQTKLKVLRDYSKLKQLTLLKANIKMAEGKLKAKKKTWELDQHRLAEIQDQIAKCTIVAPSAGQVVYANDNERRGSSGDLLIAEGSPVRERQVIIRLPDQDQMSVVAKVHESRINHLRPGMDASVTLDAYPDENLSGNVASISEYPLPTYNIYMSHVKEYEVGVEIANSLPNLRPGMSAEVRVQIANLEDVLQIPIHAVIERNERFFCAVPSSGDTFETREIQIGPINESSTVVTGGIGLGETVVLKFPGLEEELDLPEKEQPKSDEVAE